MLLLILLYLLQILLVSNSLPLCNKCHKGSTVYRRTYSGEYLCRKCFLYSIEQKTARTISKFSMLKFDDRVAVGVSGGKDSLTLLYILKKMFAQRNRTKLIAITIDEGIKGYRDESLEIVKDFCSKLNVHSKILSYDYLYGTDMDKAMVLRPSGKKMTSCSICGTFRRRAMDIAAESVGANVLATAHNLDDQLQTYMINVLAGDVERVGWIYPEPIRYSTNNIKKIKPFVEIYENEIAFYALQRQIPFQSEECPYMHESIRTQVRQFLNELEKEHPGIKYNAYNSTMRISKNLKSSMRPAASSKCAKCGRISNGKICSVCNTIKALRQVEY
jgi:cytoplasmic tRNA 2-thiolation protein 1